jgi:hypothetical protein
MFAVKRTVLLTAGSLLLIWPVFRLSLSVVILPWCDYVRKLTTPVKCVMNELFPILPVFMVVVFISLLLQN